MYRDIKSLRISNSDLDDIKARLRESVFSSYRETSKFMENNLNKAEFDTLKSLIRNKEQIIQKTDKRNNVVLLNRKDYISKMKLILADTSEFEKIQVDDTKVINQLNHMENKIIQLLRKSTMNVTLQVQNQIFYMVFVKSTKVLLMESHLFVLYCQL